MGGSFEIVRPRSRGWKTFGRRWTRGMRGLENWTTFMNVICVSSLTVLRKSNKYYFKILTKFMVFLSILCQNRVIKNLAGIKQ